MTQHDTCLSILFICFVVCGKPNLETTKIFLSTKNRRIFVWLVLCLTSCQKYVYSHESINATVDVLRNVYLGQSQPTT